MKKSAKMKTPTILFITATYIFLGLNSCKPKDKTETGPQEVLGPNAIELNAAQYAAAGVQLGFAGRQKLNSVLKVNGTINTTPQNLASVSAPLGGFVRNTSIVQGSGVSKGQVLATIENFAFIEIQQSYLETRAKFQFAEIEFKRHSELYKDNVYSEKNVQQTEADYKTLKAQMKGLEQKLISLGIDPAQLTEDKITRILPVIAPISGFIRMVNVNIGKYVSPTDVMFEIVNPVDVVLEMVVFEKDIQKVMDGQHVRFSSPNEPAKFYSAIIYQAGRALKDDKTAMVYARIDKSDPSLLAGIFVNAEIETSSQISFAVPDEAIVQFYEKSYIFAYKGQRVENGKIIHDFIAIEVTKGVNSNGFSEILLPEGYDPKKTRLVLKGAYAILSAWKNAGEMAC